MTCEPCFSTCPNAECANCVRFDRLPQSAQQKPRTPTSPTWGPHDDLVLLKHYRSKGWAYCQGLLETERTEWAIRSRAWLLEKHDGKRKCEKKTAPAEPKPEGKRHEAYMAGEPARARDRYALPRAPSIFHLAQGITV